MNRMFGQEPMGSRVCRFAVAALALLTVNWEAQAASGLLDNVPEAAGYKLVYEFSIPVNSPGWYATAVPYTVDNSASIKTGSFDRVAYYMELVKTAGPTQWVYVSTTAFTTNAARLGVPRNYMFRHNAYDTANPSNATIRSNMSGITETNGCNTVNLEFWPSNYGGQNDYGIPGAVVTGTYPYDFGDGGATNNSGGHASMQIHNYGAGQTLFAYNQWGGTASASNLGIGNQPTGNPDWTFETANISTFTVRTLQVLVRPSLKINNLPATNVTDTAGWMNAQAEVSESCDVYAYWGDADQATNSTLWANSALVGSYSNGVFNITHPATGLTGGATNWYTFQVSNDVKTVWATPSLKFVTATTPAVDNGAGASVSAGQAVLRGNLTAGNTSDIYIYWGPSDGGQSTNYEHAVKLTDVPQGAFSTTVTGTSGFTFHYICFASNAAGMAWSPASTNFALPAPAGGYTYSLGLRGSMFQPVTFSQTALDLSGGSYTPSLTRVFTGIKANTVLSMSELPSKNILLFGAANSWSEFGGSPGDNFVAALSGRFFPSVSGAYNFRWSEDDRGWLFIDTGDDGVFDGGDAVGTWAWDSNGSRTLTAGQGYNFMFFSQDSAGGESLAFWYTPPGSGELVVNPSAQAGQWRYPSGIIPLASIGNTRTGAGSVTTHSATLTADLYGKGFSFDVYAYWGQTDGQNVPANWATNAFVGRFEDWDGAVSLAVDGLEADALYSYTFCISNELMTIWAATPEALLTGELSIEASDASASEAGPATGRFRVIRPAAATNGALTVNYTLSGTAVNGSDYMSLSGSVVIPAGADSAEFTVTPSDDLVWQEGDETVVATLASGSYLIGATSSATVTIQDGDVAPSEWFLRMPLQFTGYNRAETLTNFPALVTLDTTLSGFSYSQFLSGANGDLRFTDETMTRELPYEIESWNPSGPSRVWVQVPAFTNNVTVWMLWRKAGLTPPAYTTNGATWSEGYVVVAHQSEAYGNVLESTPYRNNGIASGFPVQDVPGVIAGGDQFDGMDDYIAFGTLGRPINNFSFSAWIKTSQGHEIDAEATSGTAGSTGQKYAFDPEQISNNGGAGLSIGTNGLSVYENSSTYQPPLAVYSADIGSDWNHVTVTYVNKQPRIYLNGALVRTGLTSTRSLVYAPFRTGLQANGYGNLVGSMDETRISAVPRSANWIWAEYMTAASNSVLATYGGVQSVGYPEIACQPASGVAANAATLNGHLSATGMAETAVAVYWGTQDGGTDAGAWANTNWLSGSAAPGEFASNITGLSSGTTYFFRYLATNAYGAVWAPATETLLTAAVTLQATDTSAAEEPMDAGAFTVSRGAAQDGPLTVYYTLSGTAANGVDCSILTGSVTIPGGAASAEIVVTPLFNRNYLVRATDTVTLTLASGGYMQGGQASGTVTITNWQPSTAVQRDVPRNFTATTVEPFSGPETLAKTSAGQLLAGNPASSTFTGDILVDADGGILRVGGIPGQPGTGLTLPGMTAANTVTIKRGGTFQVEDNALNNAACYVANRFGTPGNRPGVNLAGGTLLLNGPNVATTVQQTFSDLNLDTGASTVTASRNTAGTPELVFSALNPAKGAHVNFTGSSLGAAVNASRIRFEAAPALVGAGGAAGSTTMSIVPKARSSSEFVTHHATTGIRALAAAEYNAVAGNDVNGAGATENVKILNATPTTLPALSADKTVNSLVVNINANLTWPVSNKLTITSGQLLSGIQNNSMNFSTGTFTAGSGEDATLDVSVFQSTTYIRGRIENNGSGTVTLVKNGGATLNLDGSFDHTYSGGTFINEGSITLGTGTANRRYLGTGPVRINSGWLNLGHIGATANASGADYTAVNAGQVGVATVAYTLDDLFNISAGSVLSGSASTGLGLNSLDRGIGVIGGAPNIVLAADAVVAHATALAAPLNPALGTVRNPGTGADLYYGLAANQDLAAGAITIGSNTAFKGVSTDRSDRRWGSGTINVTPDTDEIYLQGLARPGAAPALLYLGNGLAAGGPVLAPAAALTVNVLGDVRLDDSVATYGNTSAGKPVTFAVKAGATLNLNQAAAMGSGTGLASARIEDGGSLMPNNAAGINGAVTVEAGGRLIAGNFGGLSGTGAVTFSSGSILDITAATGFRGPQADAIAAALAPGQLVRLSAGNFGYPDDTLDSRLGDRAPIYELFAGDRAAANPFVVGTPVLTLNRDATTGAGGMLVNDYANRALSAAANGVLVIGPNGGTIAASSNTTLYVQQPMSLGAHALTIGATNVLDRMPGPKLGTVQLSAALGLNTAQAGSSITVIPGATLNNSANAIPDAADIIVNGTLLLGGAETIGSLAGTGLVNLQTYTLSAGCNNNDSEFAGLLTNALGTLSFTKNGTGRLRITSRQNAFTAPFTVANGILTLSGAGSITNTGTTSFTLTGNGKLQLDNSAVNNRDRLDGAPPSVVFNGGTFQFIGKDGEASGEALGTAAFSSGASTIDIVNGTGAGSSVEVVFDAAAPSAGTVTFTATNGVLGQAGDNPRVFFNGLSAGLLGFATVGAAPAFYDTETGVRAYTLAEGTEFDGTTVQTGIDTKYTTANNHAPLDAARTVNSLWVDNPGAARAVDLGSSGANNLTLTSGRLLLTGANDFALTRSGTSSGTLTRDLNGSIFLGVAAERTLTVGVPIANGGGMLEMDGPGTLILSATNTSSGTLTINAGTVRYAAGYSGDLNGNAVNIWNAGVLDFAGDTDSLGNLSVFSGGVTNSAANGILTVSSLTMGGGPAGSSTYVHSGTGSLKLGGNVTFSALNDPAKATIAGNLDLNNGNRTFIVNNSVAPDAATVDMEVSAVISGAAGNSVTKNGAGTLKLAGANTFNGNVSIPDWSGSIILAHPQALGVPANGRTLSVGSGDSLLLDGANGNIAIPNNYTTLTLNGGGDSILGVIRGAVMSQAGSNTIPCAVTLSGSTYLASLQDGGSLTLSGNISGTQDLAVFGEGDTLLSGALLTGAKALNKYGTGTLTLSGIGTNTLSGTTSVNAGKLVLAKLNGAIGFNALAGAVNVNNGAVLQYAAASTNPDMIGTFAVGVNGSGQLDFNGASDTVGNLSVDASGAMTDSTNILNTAGGGTLTVGTLTVKPIPDYLTRIETGTGTLKLGGNLTFNSAYSGRVQINGNLSLGGTARTLTVNTGTDTNYDLAIDAVLSGGAANVGFTKDGGGTLRLGGANTLDGSITAADDRGTLVLANSQALGTPSAARTVTLGNNDTLALDGAGIYDPFNRIALSLKGIGDARWGLYRGALLNLSGSNTVQSAVTLAANTQFASQKAGSRLALANYVGGPYTLTVVGAGETALAGFNGSLTNGSGITLSSNGTLTLENSALTNNANRIANTIPVTLSGGTLRFSHDGGATNFSETAGALVVSAGSNAVFASQAATGQTSALVFASLTRTGGTVNFSGEGLGASDRNRIFITGQPEGMIGPWATVNGASPAFYSAANGVYAGSSTEVGIAARGSDTENDIIPHNETASAVINLAGSEGPITLEALWTNRVLEVRQETAYAATVAMSNSVGNKTLQTSRLMIKEGQAALTVGEAENYRGTLTALAAGGTVALENQNAAALLTVNAEIANSGAISGLSKYGMGPVLLTGSNSYSGATLLGEGTLEFGSWKAQKLSGVISGAGTLVKSGTNLLHLAGTNTFTGPVYINAGIVRPDLNSTFGNTAGGVFIASGATLDLACDSTVGGTRTADQLDFGAEEFTVSGAGVNGAGVIVNNGGQNQGSAVHRVFLSGDTTFGGTRRWDLHATSFLVMNDHTLTKTGTSEVVLQNTPVYPGTGHMVVNQGLLRLESGTLMSGSASNSVSVSQNGVLDLYSLTPYAPAWSLTLNDRSVFRGSSNGTTYGTNINIWAGPVLLNGKAFFNGGANYVNWTCAGAIAGNGTLVRDGNSTATLWLTGTNNTYAGGTIVSNGTLYAKYPGSLPGYNDGRLTVAGGATLGVHASEGTFGFTAENVRDLNAASAFVANTAYLGIDTSFADLECPYDLPKRMGVAKQGTNTLTLSGNAVLGNVTVNNGTLVLAGNSIVSGNLAVVYGKAVVSGTNTHAGGSAEIYAGSSTVTNATLTLTAGASLACAFNFRIGMTGGSGAFYLDGGSFSNAQAASDYNFAFGRETNSYGYFRMTGGNVTAGRFQTGGNVGDVNARGRGLVRISGGSLTFTEYILLGRNIGCDSVLTLDGGTITHTNGNALALCLSGGRAELNLTGGTFNNANMNVWFQNNTGAGTATGTGIVNLCAGSLTSAAWQNVNNAKAYLNFCGGTLAASGDSTAFVPGNMTGVYAFGAFGTFTGGAVIDSNGKAITIPAIIRNPTGAGVASITLASQGAGYIGEPYVAIDGGSGTGATAVANMVDDGTGKGTFKVASVTVTCPGVDYASQPTVLFKGGGFNIVTALVGTVTLSANTGGGLTKLGAGTLTLSAANTYTGTTTIAAGTLKLGTAAALMPNTPIVLAGGTLDLNGYTVTNAISGSGQVTNGTLATLFSPAGTGTVGTNTLALVNTFVKGTYLADVTAAGASDRVNIQGNINLSDLALQIVDTDALTHSKVYTILTCTGARTGTFKSTNLPDSRWHVIYRADGSVQLFYARGTLLRVR